MARNEAVMYPVVMVFFLYYLISQGVGLPLEDGKCPHGHFMCLDGNECIDLKKYCDGDNDCKDGTDEYNCSAEVTEVTEECGDNSFRCAGTDKCLPNEKRCDKTEDCDDGSDEHDCVKCVAPDNFLCNDGTCIEANLLCNNNNDCKDGSDESNCTLSMITTTDPFACTKDEYRCPDGTCMSKYRLCDGQNDCNDGSDEIKGCEMMEMSTEQSALEHDDIETVTQNAPVISSVNMTGNCSEEEFRCLDGTCIPHIQICNGAPDCPDHSDEIQGCYQVIYCWDGFLCKNGHCIPKEWRCDKNDDCKDNSDEQYCAGKFRRMAEQKTLEEEKIENVLQERKFELEVNQLRTELLELQQNVAKEELRVAQAAVMAGEVIAEEQIRAAQLNRQAAEDQLRYQSELHWLKIEAQTHSTTPISPNSFNSATSQEA